MDWEGEVGEVGKQWARLAENAEWMFTCMPLDCFYCSHSSFFSALGSRIRAVESIELVHFKQACHLNEDS